MMSFPLTATPADVAATASLKRWARYPDGLPLEIRPQEVSVGGDAVARRSTSVRRLTRLALAGAAMCGAELVQRLGYSVVAPWLTFSPRASGLTIRGLHPAKKLRTALHSPPRGNGSAQHQDILLEISSAHRAHGNSALPKMGAIPVVPWRPYYSVYISVMGEVSLKFSAWAGWSMGHSGGSGEPSSNFWQGAVPEL